MRGETYFHCAPNHGVLVHHSKVQIIGAEASSTPSTPARPDSAVSNTIANPTKYAAAARQRQTSGGADYAEVDGVTKQVQDNALAVGSLRKQLGVEQQEVRILDLGYRCCFVLFLPCFSQPPVVYIPLATHPNPPLPRPLLFRSPV